MKLSEIKVTPIIESIKLINLSDEQYFSKEYSDYISNSKLSLINPDQGGSPQMYFEGMSKHSQYTDSLYFGSAVHEMVLQPNDFYVVDSVSRPTAKLGFVADEIYNHCTTIDLINAESETAVTEQDYINASNKIDYYKNKMDSDRMADVFMKCKQYWSDRRAHEYYSCRDERTPIYLSDKDRERLNECLKSVANNKKIQKLLHPEYIMKEPISLNEYAIFVDVEVEVPGFEPIILKLKAKLDNFTITETGKVTLNDLKTTGKYLNKFEESFEKYHYYRQMGMYSWLLGLVAEHIYNVKDPSITANMLLVSTVPLYYSGVYEVSKGQMIRGFKEFLKLLKTVAYCIVNEYDGSVGSELSGS